MTIPTAAGRIVSVLLSMIIFLGMTTESTSDSSANVLTRSAIGHHDNVDIVGLFDAINRLIEFFRGDHEARTPDAQLGMVIAKVQLEAIVASSDCLGGTEMAVIVKDMVEPLLQRLSAIVVQQTDGKLQRGRRRRESNGVFGEIVSKRLLMPQLWTSSANAICRCRAQQNVRHAKLAQSLSTTPPVLGQPKTTTMADYEHLFDHIDQGLPSSYDSDKCLAEILNGLPHRGCMLSSQCLNRIMSLDETSHGYHLTHKLLYYMMLSKNGCASSLPIVQTIDGTIYELCQQILNEQNLISSAGFPRDMRDLVIEQTFLCAHNGFAEFHSKPLINEILRWQHTDSGCYVFDVYGADTDPLNWKQSTPSVRNIRRRRAALKLRNNCSDHMSGLALATLTQFFNLGLLKTCMKNDVKSFINSDLK